MPFASWLAGPQSQGLRSLRPQSAWKRLAPARRLGSGARRRRSRQAVARCMQAGLALRMFCASQWRPAAGFFCASRIERSLRNFDGIAAAGRFDFDTLVKFFGLAARLSSPVSAIFTFSFAVDFDQIYFPHRSSSDVRTSCTPCTAGCRRTNIIVSRENID